MKENDAPAYYKNMIAGLVPPFILVEIMFVALAVYLFVAYSDRPVYGAVFLGIAAVVTAVFVTVLLVLRHKAKRAEQDRKK